MHVIHGKRCVAHFYLVMCLSSTACTAVDVGFTTVWRCTQEMKSEGKYVARGLAFKDAEFVQEDVTLSEGQEQARIARIRFN